MEFNTVTISKLLYDDENNNNKIMRDINQKFYKTMDDGDFEKTFKLEKYIDATGFFKRDMFSMSKEVFIIILSQHRGTWKFKKKQEIIKKIISG